MIDHVGLRVKNLEAAARLYAAMLAPLGHVPGASGDAYAGFGPKGKPALWLHLDKKGGGAHVALRAGDRAAVKAFYEAGLKAGAKDNGAPGLRTEYAANYYAAFLLDADGNNVEAVCMR
jgi:catechol 2,3-dioxygenase-like lactoylglutathione lyase family enzyme